MYLYVVWSLLACMGFVLSRFEVVRFDLWVVNQMIH